MSPTERGLWAAVLADPGDDLPRLIYADYLEENGRAPLAHFIRAQITLSQCPPGHPNYADAVEAQSLAVAAARGASSLPAPTLPDGATFAGSIREIEGDNYGSYERGFASRVTFSGLRMRTGPGDLARSLTRVVNETAIRDLNLLYVADSGLAELLTHPAANLLTGLGLTDVRADSPEQPRMLAECPHFGGVRRLTLGLNTGRSIASARRRSPEDWAAVASASWVAGVRHFQFTDPWLTDQFVLSFGPEVTSLTLRGFHPTGRTPFEIAGAGRLSVLKDLTLSGTSLSASSPNALARLPLPALASLRLELFAGPGQSLTRTLAAPYLTELTELTVTGALGSVVQALSQNGPIRQNLRIFHNDGDEKDDASWTAFADPDLFPRLSTLSLARRTAANGLARFAEVWRGETLHTLILDRWPAPAAALQKLAANPAFKSLRRLRLAHCDISDAGGVALARSPHLQNLVELDVSYNKLAEKSAALFLDNSIMPNLVLADLTTNKMHPDTRTRLRASRVGMWA